MISLAVKQTAHVSQMCSELRFESRQVEEALVFLAFGNGLTEPLSLLLPRLDRIEQRGKIAAHRHRIHEAS